MYIDNIIPNGFTKASALFLDQKNYLVAGETNLMSKAILSSLGHHKVRKEQDDLGEDDQYAEADQLAQHKRKAPLHNVEIGHSGWRDPA